MARDGKRGGCKVVLLGSMAVGKTMLTETFVNEKYIEKEYANVSGFSV